MTVDSKELSQDAFSSVAMAALGFAQIAYIRPVKADGQVEYAVCAADGTELAKFPTRDEAFFTARAHDLEPVQLH